MAKKSVITVSNRADKSKTDLASIARENPALARRLASGNINGGGNRDLPLAEPERWHTYLANTYANDNAFWEMRELGWLPLEVADLRVKPEECGFRLSPDGHIVRGPEGKEMLWKMDREHYRILEQIRTDQNNQGIGSSKKARHDMAEAAASAHGSEAGEFMASLKGEVIDSIAGH